MAFDGITICGDGGGACNFEFWMEADLIKICSAGWRMSC